MSEQNYQEPEKEDGSECWNYAGPNVARLIEHCDKLLDYASDHGIKFDEAIPEDLSKARAAFARGRWTSEHEKKLYTAKSALSHAIEPVTLHTFCDSTIKEAEKITRFYFRLTFALVVFIVPASMIVFTDSTLSAKGKDLIKGNDQIALDLHNELRTYVISIKKDALPGSSPAQASSVKVAASANNAEAPGKAALTTSVALDPQPVLTDPTLALLVTPSALELKKKLQEFARNNGGADVHEYCFCADGRRVGCRKELLHVILAWAGAFQRESQFCIRDGDRFDVRRADDSHDSLQVADRLPEPVQPAASLQYPAHPGVSRCFQCKSLERSRATRRQRVDRRRQHRTERLFRKRTACPGSPDQRDAQQHRCVGGGRYTVGRRESRKSNRIAFETGLQEQPRNVYVLARLAFQSASVVRICNATGNIPTVSLPP